MRRPTWAEFRSWFYKGDLRRPWFCLALAVAQGSLGYLLLRKGDLLWGGFLWWLCGVNCGQIDKVWREQKARVQGALAGLDLPDEDVKW